MTWTVKPPAGAESHGEAKDFMIHNEAGAPIAVCLTGRNNAEIIAQGYQMWELLNNYEAALDDLEGCCGKGDYPLNLLHHLRLETQALLRLVQLPQKEPVAPTAVEQAGAITPEELEAFMGCPMRIPEAAFGDALLYGRGFIDINGEHIPAESVYDEQRRAEDATYESEGGSHEA